MRKMCGSGQNMRRGNPKKTQNSTTYEQNMRNIFKICALHIPMGGVGRYVPVLQFIQGLPQSSGPGRQEEGDRAVHPEDGPPNDCQPLPVLHRRSGALTITEPTNKRHRQVWKRNETKRLLPTGAPTRQLPPFWASVFSPGFTCSVGRPCGKKKTMLLVRGKFQTNCFKTIIFYSLFFIFILLDLSEVLLGPGGEGPDHPTPVGVPLGGSWGLIFGWSNLGPNFFFRRLAPNN